MKAVVSIRSPPAACNVDARQGACRTAAPSCWRALFRQRAYDGRIMFHRRPCDRGSQDCSRQTAGGFQDSRRYYELAADHRLSHGDRAADSWPSPGWNAGAPNPDHARPPDDRRLEVETFERPRRLRLLGEGSAMHYERDQCPRGPEDRLFPEDLPSNQEFRRRKAPAGESRWLKHPQRPASS
jgi:hypothetical protein